VEIGKFEALLFGDAAHGALQRVLGGGDAAVMARLRVAVVVEDCDDRLFFMTSSPT
jgi:hypothetical protein